MPAAARVGHRLRSVARIARFGVQALVGLIYGQIVEFTEPRSQLARCGSGTYFFQRCSIRCPHNITIGSNVSVGPDNRLWASPGATITVEDDVLFGPNVTIVTSNHGTADLTRSIAAQPWIESDVLIGRGAWLAANVVVLPGVTIGAGAVIAAGAVVAASIPPLAIAGGVPARVLKSRDDSA